MIGDGLCRTVKSLARAQPIGSTSGNQGAVRSLGRTLSVSPRPRAPVAAARSPRPGSRMGVSPPAAGNRAGDEAFAPAGGHVTPLSDPRQHLPSRQMTRGLSSHRHRREWRVGRRVDACSAVASVRRAASRPHLAAPRRTQSRPAIAVTDGPGRARPNRQCETGPPSLDSPFADERTTRPCRWVIVGSARPF